VVGTNTDRKRAALTVNRQRAKEMSHTPVSAEKLLWAELRNRKLGGFKFKRQVPIGRYIADFVCFEQKLIVELDGPLHVDRRAYDANRDEDLRVLGYRVLRFLNDELGDDFESCSPPFSTFCAAAPPHPDPLPLRGRGESTAN
jgi:very-short-patch-repair endonuclease